MLDVGRGGRRWLLGSLALFAVPVTLTAAGAHTARSRAAGSGLHAAYGSGHVASARGYGHAGRGEMVQAATWMHGRGEHVRIARGAFRYARGGYGGGSYASAYGHASVLQCVAFAREDSGIALSGNAADWWDNAAGLYARGAHPEAGAVLSFRANGRMRLGHVAVVSRVINGRTVEVDHSHWMGGGVARDMAVVDVSENNDWSAVRVELGHTGSYGSIYPTHGFIYDRADGGREEGRAAASPMPVLDRAPHDLRGRRQADFEEVAEVPERGRGIDLSTASFEGPSRSLR